MNRSLAKLLRGLQWWVTLHILWASHLILVSKQHLVVSISLSLCLLLPFSNDLRSTHPLTASILLTTGTALKHSLLDLSKWNITVSPFVLVLGGYPLWLGCDLSLKARLLTRLDKELTMLALVACIAEFTSIILLIERRDTALARRPSISNRVLVIAGQDTRYRLLLYRL